MPEFTIITTIGSLTVEGSHWARSDDGGVYVYPDSDASDPVAEVDADDFVAIGDTNADVQFHRSEGTPQPSLH